MIDCTITSSQKAIVYKNIESITLPVFSGQIQVSPNHAESFVLLKRGDISLKQLNKQSKIIQITSGECCVKNNAVTIIL